MCVQVDPALAALTSVEKHDFLNGKYREISRRYVEVRIIVYLVYLYFGALSSLLFQHHELLQVRTT